MASNITQTGIAGLKGLSSLTNVTLDDLRKLDLSSVDSSQLSSADNFILNKDKNRAELTQTYSPTTDTEQIGLELGSMGVGDSRFDKRITDMNQANDINEFRAQQQSALGQLGNGLLKRVTTAGTTFIDGTLGSLVGLITGIANLADDDETTGFWRGFWDNAVTNAMADAQEKMEEIAPNYMSKWEQDANFFQRMFSTQGAANFWGNDILKNAGFTIGAAAAIYATGGFGSLLKGSATLAKLGATKAGKFASWIAKSFTSSVGEASIEALNATRENEKAMNVQLDIRRSELMNNAKTEYLMNISSGMSEEEAALIYNEKTTQIENDIQKYKQQMQKELSDAGNTIFAVYLAVLTVSNNLILGSLIRGGYGNAQSLLSQAIKTVDGKAVTSAKDIAQGLAKNTLRFEAPKVENATAKSIGHWLLSSTQEGLEEGVQNLASSSGNIVAQARMNKWASDYTSLGTMINPDATEQLVNYSRALSKAYEENFGALNSQGWTEVAAGFISGALGVPGMHRNNEGKLRPTWNGGFAESLETINGRQKEVAKQAELLNKSLADNKFNETAKHAITQIAIKDAQDQALADKNTLMYKNLEVDKIVDDALYFKELGMLDDYFNMYQALAQNVTDQDINELKAMAKSEDGSPSALENKTTDELKSLYQEKAKSVVEKAKQALQSYESLDKQYGDKFSPSVRDVAIRQLTFLDSLGTDTERRLNEVIEEKEQLQKKESLTLSEQLRLKELEIAEKELQKQAIGIRKEANKYKFNPKLLESEIEERRTKALKQLTYKEANKAIESYQRAQTLEDAIDIYQNSPIENREEVLEQAISKAEGEAKEHLVNLKNFIEDTNAVRYYIADKIQNPELARQFSLILNNIESEMLSDDSPVLSRDTLKEKLQEVLQDVKNQNAEAAQKAGRISVDENGKLQNLEEAFAAGEFSEDELETELINPDTNETRTTIKEGSNLEIAANAASLKAFSDEAIKELSNLIESLEQIEELKEANKKAKEVKKKTENRQKKKNNKKEEKEEEGFSEEEGQSFDENEDEEEEEEETDEEEDEEDEEESSSFNIEELTSKLLSKDEQKLFEIVPIEGEKSGFVFIGTKTKSGIKIEPSNKIAVKFNVRRISAAERIDDLISELKTAKTDKKKKEILNKIVSIISSRNLSNSAIKKIDQALSKYSHLLKPTKENKSITTKKSNAEAHSKKEREEETKKESIETVSLNGTQYTFYVPSELKKKRLVIQDSPVQNWLRSEGHNIQNIVDHYLYKVITKMPNIKVHYLKNTKQEQLSNVVFLAIPYTDEVQKIIPEGTTKVLDAKDINIDTNDKYILIGTLGYDNAFREKTEEMFHTLSTEGFETESNDKEWQISTKYNNVKDISSGEYILSEANSQVEDHDVADLLTHKSVNPKDVKIEDIKWIVIEGEEGDIKLWYSDNIDVENELPNIYNVEGYPGQVYVCIPTNNGKYMPIYIKPKYYKELNSDKSSELISMTQQLLKTLASFDASDEDKTTAITKLRSLYVFSKHNQIYFNAEDNKNYPNSIYIVENGITKKIIDFTSDERTDEEVYQDLLQALESINPRINIDTTTINSNPDFYFRNNVLETNVSIFSTMGSRLYIYPVDNEGNIIKNEIKKSNQIIDGRSIKKRVDINGEYVYYDGENFYNEQNELINDEDGNYEVAYQVLYQELKPIEYDKGKYYIVNDKVYAHTGHHAVTLVDKATQDKVLKFLKKKPNKKELEKANKEIKKKQKEREEKETETKKSVASLEKYNLKVGDSVYYKGTAYEITEDENSSFNVYVGKQKKTVNSFLEQLAKGTYTDKDGNTIVEVTEKEEVSNQDSSTLSEESNDKDKNDNENYQISAKPTTLLPAPSYAPNGSFESIKKDAIERKKSGVVVYTSGGVMGTVLGIIQLAIEENILRNVSVHEEYITADDYDSVVEQLQKMGINSFKELAYINPNTFNRKEAIKKARQKEKEQKENNTKQKELLNNNEPLELNHRIIISSSLGGYGVSKVFGFNPSDITDKEAYAKDIAFWKKTGDTRNIKNPSTGNTRENFYKEFPEGHSVITYYSDKYHKEFDGGDGAGFYIWRKLTPIEVEVIQNYLWNGANKSFADTAMFIDKVMHTPDSELKNFGRIHSKYTVQTVEGTETGTFTIMNKYGLEIPLSGIKNLSEGVQVELQDGQKAFIHVRTSYKKLISDNKVEISDSTGGTMLVDADNIVAVLDANDNVISSIKSFVQKDLPKQTPKSYFSPDNIITTFKTGDDKTVTLYKGTNNIQTIQDILKDIEAKTYTYVFGNEYLDQLIDLMKDNPQLKVRIQLEDSNEIDFYIASEESSMLPLSVYLSQKEEQEQKHVDPIVEDTSDKKQFNNGNKVDGLISQDALDNSEKNTTFVQQLRQRDNKSQKQLLMQLVSQKLNRKINSIDDLLKGLQDLNIDTVSNDLNTIISFVNTCK